MDDGSTALHIAAFKGHTAVVKALNAGGTNVNAMSKRTDTYNSGALGTASVWCRLHVAKTLLAAGANVWQLDSIGDKCLHTAVNEGYIDFTDPLLKAGADPNARGEDGKTPLCMAQAQPSSQERSKITDLLERHGAV